MAKVGGKTKKPPTFQHLPLNRARKLKREWVTAAKIRSKWTALKRREGLTNARLGVEQAGEERSDNKKDVSKSIKRGSRSISEEMEAPSTISNQLSTSDDDGEDDVQEPKLPFRELTRQAYSRSSLHSHKSKPFQNSHARKPYNNNAAQESNHNSPAANRHRKGQPDMKLRMNVVLEKIKRDLT